MFASFFSGALIATYDQAPINSLAALSYLHQPLICCTRKPVRLSRQTAQRSAGHRSEGLEMHAQIPQLNVESLSSISPRARGIVSACSARAIARRLSLFLVLAILGPASLTFGAAEPLPFEHKVELHRNEKGDVIVFALRLEQPFLAEEFEKSNYLRLQAIDDNAYLIYPKETKFVQKHAEFYGRLRGGEKTRLRLSYEIVSENLDGSRKVDVRHSEITMSVPQKETGPTSIYHEWAIQQNQHFSTLLEYYPNQSFLQYVLLQSKSRYGVSPPSFSSRVPSADGLEANLYYFFSGGLAVQEALQRQTLSTGGQQGDLTIHVSQLRPPRLKSHDYEGLLEAKQEAGVEPVVHDISRLVPADQYFLHFRSMETVSELLELTEEWGGSLLRLYTMYAREHHVRDKLATQLCVQDMGIRTLFQNHVITELATTGADVFVAEGSDLTVIFRVQQWDAFRGAATGWVAHVKEKHTALQEREFNYRGHKVMARFTDDRAVSSFVVHKDDYAIYSNSHRAIRRIIDTMIGEMPNLYESLDYRYMTTLLAPPDDAKSAYLFASEAFLKRMVSPAFKISQKRRLQCFNNLVMLNNATLFYRLEHGRSPASLTDLVEGRFVDPRKLVCPHGGAYSFDESHDSSTCSLHNRIKYLTPNVELNVLRVSEEEQQEYERYRGRYRAFWGQVFNPLAVRIQVGSRVKVETAVLPFSNSGIYGNLREILPSDAAPLDTNTISASAVASLAMVPGRERIRDLLRAIPGVPEVLQADPTLTDLEWIGDRLSLHFCDDDTILEVDPTKLQRLTLIGNTPVGIQMIAAAAVAATNMPVYFTLDVEDEERAGRLLEHLGSRIFLKQDDMFGLKTRLDAYEVPSYKGHRIHVVTYQIYAVKVRLYLALVKKRLVAATKAYTLQEVIDASENQVDPTPPVAHAMVRLNQRAYQRMREDLQIYWAEKSRQACHRNIMSIYNLVKLYGVPIQDVDRLSDAKYGVTYFCPDGADYRYDASTDQVTCDLHGNRRHARQALGVRPHTSFARFLDSLNEVIAYLKFTDEGMLATIEISRTPRAPKESRAESR